MRTIEKAAKAAYLNWACFDQPTKDRAVRILQDQIRYLAENPSVEAVRRINLGKYWELPEVGSERYEDASKRFTAALMAIVEEK